MFGNEEGDRLVEHCELLAATFDEPDVEICRRVGALLRIRFSYEPAILDAQVDGLWQRPLKARLCFLNSAWLYDEPGLT